MFQFSDDIDDEVLEDVLSISTTQIANENTNNVTNCSTSETSVKNDSNIALEEFDEDDLILSAAFEDANSSFRESQKSTYDSPVLKRNTTSTQISSNRISHSRDSGYGPSPIVAKHKSPNSFNSPNAVKHCKIEYERRFAGPAGLIPKKSKENSVVPVETIVLSKSQMTAAREIEDSFCDSSPSWRALQKDVNSDANKFLQRINDFTISNVYRLNLAKDTSWKIPIFAAIIFNIDSSVTDPDVTLRDPSGEIMGTFDKDLWDEYNHLLSVGSALLLRQVSVLSLIGSRKAYLNITKYNIVTIYTAPNGDKPLTVTQVRIVSESDFLNETKTDKYSRRTNSPASSISASKNSCSNSKVRSNADLLTLLKNSDNSDSQDASSLSRQPVSSSFPRTPELSSLPKTPSKNHVPNSKSNSVATSSSIISKSPPNTKLGDSKASLIFNELEGLDADDLFDDF